MELIILNDYWSTHFFLNKKECISWVLSPSRETVLCNSSGSVLREPLTADPWVPGVFVLLSNPHWYNAHSFSAHLFLDMLLFQIMFPFSFLFYLLDIRFLLFPLVCVSVSLCARVCLVFSHCIIGTFSHSSSWCFLFCYSWCDFPLYCSQSGVTSEWDYLWNHISFSLSCSPWTYCTRITFFWFFETTFLLLDRHFCDDILWWNVSNKIRKRKMMQQTLLFGFKRDECHLFFFRSTYTFSFPH